jgi:thymidylate synthase
MNFKRKTLDDIMYDVFGALLKLPFKTESTRSKGSGAFSEILGASIELENPRARLSRTDTKGKTFSALGELLWYLAASDDLAFITYYVEEYKNDSFDSQTIYGAYGPRFFKSASKHDQIKNVITLLKQKPTSRRAVIQLFESRDIAPEVEENILSIPCTCLLHFLLRDDRLNLITYMRSNDAYKGLPHDIFTFTMIQEIIAKEVGAQLGFYKHVVGSLHLYECSKKNAEKYVKEGLQSTKHPMPEMPDGNQFEMLKKLLEIEAQIRKNEKIDLSNNKLPIYWNDLVILLAIYSAFKRRNKEDIKSLKKRLSSNIYEHYIDNKLESIK